MTTGQDSIKWNAHMTIRKYDEAASDVAASAGLDSPTDEDFERLGVKPFEVVEVPRNRASPEARRRYRRAIRRLDAPLLDRARTFVASYL